MIHQEIVWGLGGRLSGKITCFLRSTADTYLPGGHGDLPIIPALGRLTGDFQISKLSRWTSQRALGSRETLLHSISWRATKLVASTCVYTYTCKHTQQGHYHMSMCEIFYFVFWFWFLERERWCIRNLRALHHKSVHHLLASPVPLRVKSRSLCHWWLIHTHTPLTWVVHFDSAWLWVRSVEGMWTISRRTS